LVDYETTLRALSREGVDVPGRLVAEVGELADAFGKN
jgi:hypothetical protein